jgi:probable HAF family extracellular repeat protein
MYTYSDFVPVAINASGQMFGGTGYYHLFGEVYSYGTASGQVTPLVEGYGYPGASNVITPSGQTLIELENPKTYQSNTFIYNPDGSRVTLGSPSNQSGFTGTSMNSWGQVAGFSGPTNAAQAYIYSGGTFHALGSLPGDTSTMPMAINDAGQAVGYSSGPPNGSGGHSFLYSNGTMQSLPTLGGTAVHAYGISNTGVVYGDSSTVGQSNFHAFLYSNGQMIDLTNMLHSLGGSISGDDSYAIRAINDEGQILIYASNGLSSHSFLLTPDGQPLPATPGSVVAVPETMGPFANAPEPPALALFVLVVVVCGAKRRAGQVREFVSRVSGHSRPYNRF